MIITKEQLEELGIAAAPLIKWLNDNCHPNVTAIVDIGSVELFEAVARAKVEQYIKD